MTKDNEFKDKRGRTWEWFVDESYYGEICVRCLDMGKNFNSHGAFHFMVKSDAEAFIELIKKSA